MHVFTPNIKADLLGYEIDVRKVDFRRVQMDMPMYVVAIEDAGLDGVYDRSQDAFALLESAPLPCRVLMNLDKSCTSKAQPDKVRDSASLLFSHRT